MHAEKTIDMKYIKQELSLKAWTCVDLGSQARAKIQLFQNLVMLYMQLKEKRIQQYGSK